MTAEDAGFWSLTAASAAAILATVAAYITHLFWIISLLMSDVSVPAGKVIIAIVGLLVPPLGCVHGFWLWFH